MLNFEKWHSTYINNKWQNFIVNFIDKISENLHGTHAMQVGMLPIYLDKLKFKQKFYILYQNFSKINLITSYNHYKTPYSLLYTNYDALPFANNSIDCILSIHTLDILDNPDKISFCIQEMARVLSPQGKLIIIGFNPFGSWLIRHKIHRLFRKSFLPQIINDKAGITYAKIQNLMNNNDMYLSHAEFALYDFPIYNFELNKTCEVSLDNIGKRWLPNLGNIYAMVFTKQILSMHAIEVSKARNLNYSLDILPALPKNLY